MGGTNSIPSSQPNKPGEKDFEAHTISSEHGINPKRVTTESRFVLITRLKNSDNIDALKNHLEVSMDEHNSVEKIVFGSSSDKVVAIFRNPVNPMFMKRSLRMQYPFSTFKAVEKPTVVQVLDIPLGAEYLQAVKNYLMTKIKSGGTKRADFYGKPDPNYGFCLIDLKDPKVVDRVCERTHVIVEGKENCILPYYKHLGLAVNRENRPDDLTSEKLVLQKIDEEMLNFIHEKMEIELREFAKVHRIRLVDQSLNSLTFSCNLMKSLSASDEATVVIGPGWKSRVEKAFNEEFLLQLYVEKLEIKDDMKWKHLQVMKEELCKRTAAVKVYEDSRLRTFKFVSRKSDENILKSLKVKIESEEPPKQYVTDILDGYCSTKLRAFEVLGFNYDVETKTRVKLRIHVNDGKIELTGLKKNNQEAETEIAEKLGSLEERRCYPPNADYLKILISPQLIEQSNREIETKKLRGIWGIHSNGVSEEMFICYEYSEKDTFERIQNLIFGLLDTDCIVIDGDMEPEAWDGLRTKIRNIEYALKPFAQVKLLKYKKFVRITCRKDLMVECRQKIQEFINLHLICTCEAYIMAEIADYMHNKMKSQIELYLQKACGKNPDWNFKHSKFYITGNQSVRSKCTEVLYIIASKVRVTWRSIERKGIQNFFMIGAGKNMESQVTECHLKILGQDELQKQKTFAVVLTEEGQAMCIGVMDRYKQPVDGIVNVMNEDSEDFRKGANEVEREIADYIKANGKLTEEHVFVTGCGKHPCLKILHAVAPEWRGGTESEDNRLQRTIEKILSTAESNSMRSIAMPMVACRTLFGYPMRRAARILLQTIINLCSTRFKSIREIYICDMDSNKIKILKRLAEGLFGAQCFFIPRGQILKFDATIGPKPNMKLQQRQKTIVQRRGIRIIPLPAGRKVIIAWGDLARLSNCTPPLKADIIVNPSTTFPVLSGNIAQSLKAASSNGGKFDLELECKKNEPQGGLQKGSYVATDTPHMSCDQILHLRIEYNWKNINEEILQSYIKSCMNHALSSSKRSIAFPTIGTGTIGYPRDAVARCFMHAITEFSQAATSGSLEELIIVIYHRDSETTVAFEKELQSLLTKRPHRLIANIKEEILEDSCQDSWEMKYARQGSGSGSSSSANPSTSSPIPLGTYLLGNGGCLTLKHGSLEDSGAAALVSTTSAIPNVYGIMSSAIKKAAGGTTIQDELQLNYGKGIKVGEIAITGAGNIRGANKIYHLKLEDYNPQKGNQAFFIYNSVNLCLSQADTDAMSSIAFPTIGTGGFKWPAQLVADETFQAVESYFKSRPSSRPSLHINIMIFHQNSPENLVFQRTAENKFGQGGSSLKTLDYDDDEIVVTEQETNIDHDKRDFVLLKFISHSMDKTNEAFQFIRTKVDGDFSYHELMTNEVIVYMRQSDVFHGCLEKENVGKLVKQHYEWCYEEMNNILMPYPRKIGIMLENAFTQGDETYEFTDIDGLKYCVNFSKDEEFKVGLNSNKVKVVRLDRMTVDGTSLAYLCLCALQRRIQATTSRRFLSSGAGNVDHVLIKTLEEIKDTKIRKELYFYLSRQVSNELMHVAKDAKYIVWPGTYLEKEKMVFLCLYRGKVEEIPRCYFGKSLVYRDVEKPARNLKWPHTRPVSVNNDNNLTYENAMLIERAIEEHGVDLFEKHSNLEAMIGSSFMLSLREGYIRTHCVVLYCQVKGIAPYEESAFPKTLQVGNDILPVDVREGFLRQGMLQQNTRIMGEKEWHDKLRMGISIGVKNVSLTGTLGPFVKLGGKDVGFLTCAHVVDREKVNVFQPGDADSCPARSLSERYCGEVMKIYFNPRFRNQNNGLSSSIGVDAALVKIKGDRTIDVRNFPSVSRMDLEIAGFIPDDPPLFINGSMKYPLDFKIIQGKRIIKYGRTTGLRKGSMLLEGAQLRRHDAELELPNKQKVVMTNQYIIERHGHRPFFELGDSGAGIFVVDAENKLTLIGLAIGMLDLDYCVVTPIEYVLKALDLKLDNLHFEEDMDVSDVS